MELEGGVRNSNLFKPLQEVLVNNEVKGSYSRATSKTSNQGSFLVQIS